MELSLQRAFTEFLPATNVSAEVKPTSVDVLKDGLLTKHENTIDTTRNVEFEDLHEREKEPIQDPWVVQAKNTFINVSVVKQDGDESMPRNKSDPTKKNAEESGEQDDADDLPPGLPLLSLERFTTYDSFQRDDQRDDPVGNVQTSVELCSNEEHPHRASGYAHLSFQPPPPPLTLESDVTYDPFQDGIDDRSLNALYHDGIGNLPGPPELALDRIVTDDPFRTPQAVNLAIPASLVDYSTDPCCSLPPPPELSLDCIVTDDPFQPSPIESSGLLLPPGELSLDRIVTDDPLQSTLPESFKSHISQQDPVKAADFSEQSSWSSSTVPAPMYVILPASSNVVPRVPPPLVPAPPIAPPEVAAPTMEAPPAPDAPLAPPSYTPGASLSALQKTDLCQPGLLVHTHGSCTHVHWAVDGRKLERQDKQAVSPVFQVVLPDHGSAPFKIVLNAIEKKIAGDRKKGAGFHRAKGHGRIALKCEADLPQSCAEIAMRIGVGRKETQQPFRGPVIQDFLSNSCNGLESAGDEWNFTKSVDDNKVFIVTLEIAPAGAYRANPNIWWISDDGA